jgi:hypothetical protein
MYIKDHQDVGSLIHPDHSSNLQTPAHGLSTTRTSWTLHMQGASGVVQIRELKFCKSVEPPPQQPLPPPPPDNHSNLAKMQTPTPKASRQCLWQSLPPQLCRWDVGAAGQRTWPLQGLPQQLRLNRLGVGRARELECTSKYPCVQ